MNSKLLSALLFLLVGLCETSPGQSDSFLFSTDTLSRFYVPTYIGNGTIGVSSSQLGIAPTQSYMAWMFDHAPHDVARIASLPAWNGLDFFNGSTWLSSASPNPTAVQQYRQTLNMYDGTLETSYIWKDGGRATKVAITLLVSRSNPFVAAFRLKLVPQFSGRVRVAFPLRQWPGPARMPLADDPKIQVHLTNGHPDVWYPGHMAVVQRGANGSVNWVVAKPDGSTSTVAIVAQTLWSGGIANLKVTSDTTRGDPGVVAAFTAKAGKSYTFDRIIAFGSSRNSSDPLASAQGVVAGAATDGFEAVQRASARAWHDLWKTDIVVQGDEDLQKAIHSSMFYLLCSAAESTDFALPPMGLSSDGYYGHIFWDSDTWMFPPLLLTHPAIARSLVMFRYHSLPTAKENAKANNYPGAMYPWESDEEGKEATPRFAYQNALLENHVTGDVALAQWQYFLATADTPWLEKFGLPVIEATADFWAQRARYDSTSDRYSIDSVVSVDEGLIGVSNDTYTNAIARRNLEIAVRASGIVGRQPNPAWGRIAGKLVVLVDSVRRVHKPYENAPDSVIAGVAPLIVYPLEYSPSKEIARNDLSMALEAVEREGGGAMMTIMLYPVVAAQLQERDMFERFLRVNYKQWMRGSFNVFSETPKNLATNFITGAGAFLQQVLFGYTGLRITEEGLKAMYPPMLPAEVREMSITNVSFRGQLYDILVGQGTARIVTK